MSTDHSLHSKISVGNSKEFDVQQILDETKSQETEPRFLELSLLPYHTTFGC